MTAAVVLAGGAGRRMGGPKAGLMLPGLGITLVERAVAIVRAAGCGPIVVGARRDIPIPDLGDVEVVYDSGDAAGPLGGMVAAFEAIEAMRPCPPGDTVVLACDVPNALPVVKRLLAAPSGRPVVAASDGRMQPLCARYPRQRALVAARDALAAGNRRVMAMVATLEPETLAASPEELLNVNEQADLDRVVALQGGEVAAIDELTVAEGNAELHRDG